MKKITQVFAIAIISSIAASASFAADTVGQNTDKDCVQDTALQQKAQDAKEVKKADPKASGAAGNAEGK